jgi:hypothetical protein
LKEYNGCYLGASKKVPIFGTSNLKKVTTFCSQSQESVNIL